MSCRLQYYSRSIDASCVTHRTVDVSPDSAECEGGCVGGQLRLLKPLETYDAEVEDGGMSAGLGIWGRSNCEN